MKSHLKLWKTISTKTLLDHPRIQVVEDTVELPNGTHTDYVKMAPASVDSVIIIAYNNNDEVLIQREYSHPPHKIMWQLPGGSMEVGESATEGALRELAEESGFSAKNTQELGAYYVHNRTMDKRQHIVLCTDLFEHKLKEDDDEFIESFWISRARLHQMISRGEFDNVNLLAALNVWFHSGVN